MYRRRKRGNSLEICLLAKEVKNDYKNVAAGFLPGRLLSSAIKAWEICHRTRFSRSLARSFSPRHLVIHVSRSRLTPVMAGHIDDISRYGFLDLTDKPGYPLLLCRLQIGMHRQTEDAGGVIFADREIPCLIIQHRERGLEM